MSVLYSPIDLSQAIYSSDISTNGEQSDKYKKINHERVTLIYTVQTRVLDERPNKKCSNEPTPSICLVKRLMQVALDNCRCVPFAFRELLTGQTNKTKSLPYCNEQLYSIDCKSMIAGASLDAKSKCSDQCQYTFYAWKQTVMLPTEGPWWPKYYVWINTQNAPFVEFTMAVKDTEEKLISQIGGIVNLYLGVSGLSICGIGVFLVEIIKRMKIRCQKKNDQTAKVFAEDQSTNSANALFVMNNNVSLKQANDFNKEMRKFMQQMKNLPLEISNMNKQIGDFNYRFY